MRSVFLFLIPSFKSNNILFASTLPEWNKMLNWVLDSLIGDFRTLFVVLFDLINNLVTL